ncbi:AAA family ATPase [Geminisphaera colitermitum]|uniref:AAA family ATPase n=1 Tax=Geminisphaera colitermitum TaxID=1148786 RepID=UPI000158CAFD|nr:ATP/GTP-binding protein [Geminisphaera colitermitum]
MLLSLSINNYRSFREEQTLSLVASTRQNDHLEHLAAIPEDTNNVLPITAIYGANGAGKSNTVKALDFLVRLLKTNAEPNDPLNRHAFRLHKGCETQPTEISVQFIEDGNVFHYGIRIDDTTVLAEWLLLLRNKKEIPIYERITTNDSANHEVKIQPGEILDNPGEGNHEKIHALIALGVLPNQLFLQAVRTSIQQREHGPLFSKVLHWFLNRLTFIMPDYSYHGIPLIISKDSTFGDFASGFLKKAGTGVQRLRVDEEPVNEEQVLQTYPSIKPYLESLAPNDVVLVPATATASRESFVFNRTGDGQLCQQIVRAEHRTDDGSPVDFRMNEISDGTLRLTHLLPALHLLRNRSAIFVIDEIDRSLHPLLSKSFVRAFLNECTATGGQLIFTTHDTAFLDLDLLRRDEIWFAEKSTETGATSLYSLSDYKVRTDLKIDKAYLEGRFRAVPPIERELPDWVRSILNELQPCGPASDNGQNGNAKKEARK